MRVYYNEWDAFAADWLRELMKDDLIPYGDVDTRSITEVAPDDLIGYDQVHFFAGIGGWAYALRLAGWADRPVWTGSCPCQPFSAAGKGKGEADARHLWPEFRRLIAERRPPVVVGEQVASRLGRDWLAGVRADLEGLGYAVGAADLCAAGVGAPHIRQRLYWVAESNNSQRRTESPRWYECHGRDTGWEESASDVKGCRPTRGLADPQYWTPERHGYDVAGASSANQGGEEEWQRLRTDTWDGESVGGLEDPRCADGARRSLLGPEGPDSPSGTGKRSAAGITGAIGGLGHPNDQIPQGHGRFVSLDDAPGWEGAQRHVGKANFWSRAEWLPCLDGKARRVEPGIFPLADGIPHRVALLRGAGNAINAQTAEAFLRAYLLTKEPQ